jgi:hypothetical protein
MSARRDENPGTVSISARLLGSERKRVAVEPRPEPEDSENQHRRH